jgi:hypothetical protein
MNTRYLDDDRIARCSALQKDKSRTVLTRPCFSDPGFPDSPSPQSALSFAVDKLAP